MSNGQIFELCILAEALDMMNDSTCNVRYKTHPYADSCDLSGNLVGEPSDPHPQQLSGFQVEPEAELFS